MTAELWAIPALLLVVLVIGLIALVRGRSRPPPAHRPSNQAPQRQERPGRPTAAQAPAQPPFEPSVDGDLDTEPDNLHTRREAAAEALKGARQRAAQDAARLDARRQLRNRLPEPLVPPNAAAPVAPTAPASPAAPPMAAAPSRVTRAPSGLDLPLPLQAPTRAPDPTPTPRPTPVTAALAQPPAPPVAPPFAPPFAPSRAAALAPALPTHAPVASTPPYPPQARMPAPGRPFTVLVVDDSKVVRIKTSRLLEKHHYQVILADDGLTALTALSQQWPDLLITDVEMPGLDGFGLTQRVRGMPGGPALPVIMITSSNDRHRDAATQAGVNVLLGKPYPEDQLLAEVEAALAGVAQPAPAGVVMQ